MVLLWDNIRRFCRNIKLIESNNIWCYYELSKCVFWDNNVITMGQLTTFCRNINVNLGHYKMFGQKYTFDKIGQYMVLLHALKLCFLGQKCPKMGHFKTFCKNIMVTYMDNICRYDMQGKVNITKLSRRYYALEKDET